MNPSAKHDGIGYIKMQYNTKITSVTKKVHYLFHEQNTKLEPSLLIHQIKQSLTLLDQSHSEVEFNVDFLSLFISLFLVYRCSVKFSYLVSKIILLIQSLPIVHRLPII